MVGTLVMAPKSVTFRRHDQLVSVLFGDLLSHSYITFSMFLYLVYCRLRIMQQKLTHVDICTCNCNLTISQRDSGVIPKL